MAALLSPAAVPLLLLALSVSALATRSTPLFRQERSLSLRHRPFYVWKVRTMKRYVSHAGASGNFLLKEELAATVPAPLSLLRRTGIDELPQLWNIIRGEMSFIGPRPLMRSDLEILRNTEPRLHEQRSLLRSTPGLSGLWQVRGNRQKGIADLLRLDCEYERRRSLKFDTGLLVETFVAMVTLHHSDAILNSGRGFPSQFAAHAGAQLDNHQ